MVEAVYQANQEQSMRGEPVDDSSFEADPMQRRSERLFRAVSGGIARKMAKKVTTMFGEVSQSKLWRRTCFR